MDFYQMKLSDLPSDLMEKIGSYLLDDKKKTIHKIFYEKKDDNLQVLLFGEVKKLNYIDIDNVDNERPYNNENMKKYINTLLKKCHCNHVCTRMTINFYQIYGPIRITIRGYNSNDLNITRIEHWDDNEFYFDYVFNSFIWCNSDIKNKKIVKEYKRIKKEIINKYF